MSRLSSLPGQVSRGFKVLVAFLGELGLFGVLYFSQRMAEGFVAVALMFHLFGKNKTIGEAATFTIVIAVPGAMKWIWAPLCDRWGNRLSWILGATLVMAMAIFSLPWVEGLGLTAVMVLAAVAFVALMTQDLVTDGVACDVLSKERRWPVQMVMSGASALGMSVGAGLALFLLRGKHMPWEWICRMVSGFVLVTGVAIWLLWRVTPGVKEKTSEIVRQSGDWRAVFTSLVSRNVVALLVAGLFAKVAAAMTAPMIPKWFELLSFGAGWEASVVTADTWLKLGGAVVSGLLVTKFGGRRVLAVCAVLFGASYASLGVLSSYWVDATLVFVQIAAGSLAEGACSMAFFLLAMEIATSTRARVACFAVFMAAGNVSELWAKKACGLVSEAGLGMDGVFLLAGACQCLMLAGLLLMKEKGGDEKPS